MDFLTRMLSTANGKPSFARTAAFYMIVMSSESVFFAQAVLIYAIKTDHWTEAKEFLQAASIPATAIFSVQLLVALAPYIVSKISDKKAVK